MNKILEIWEGLEKNFPYTYIFMLLGTLALTGFPFFIRLLFKGRNY